MTRRKTTAEFIEQAKAVHCDRYDYSNLDYRNAKPKVIICCPVHGDFKQAPAQHLSGRGCAVCAQGGDPNTMVYFGRIKTKLDDCVKIGITVRNVKDRFRIDSQTIEGFDIKRLDSFTVQHPQKGRAIEKLLREQFSDCRYTPNTRFTGWTECFNIEAKDEIAVEFAKLKKLHGSQS
ncbi:MAG: hypothetical protein ACI87E_002005 [Mariniblastus sp.]|jgi:hypothetical protein